MEIIPYETRYKQHFIDLNMAWIEKYFCVEAHDRTLFSDVERPIQEGGMIFFAVEGEEVLATCMVAPKANGVWELCKLATQEKAMGKGAGSAVFKACMHHAIEKGAQKLVLTTNSRLKPALHIYKKLGFVQVPLEAEDNYARVDIKLAYTVEK